MARIYPPVGLNFDKEMFYYLYGKYCNVATFDRDELHPDAAWDDYITSIALGANLNKWIFLSNVRTMLDNPSKAILYVRDEDFRTKIFALGVIGGGLDV